MKLISNGQISKITCVACKELIGNHKRRELWRCLFRIQSTYMSGKIEDDLPTTVEDEKVNARH